ncbi:MAG: outer membrane protein transport protein [Parachlamydiaceae bacterium]|nr:outer membrane protein transport protein [Parachlamydiaceae bacterium]
MKFHTWKPLTAAALFTVLCITPNLTDAFSLSSKASGMGSTGIAYPQDAFAGAYNPAAIVDAENRADVGFAWTRERATSEITPGFPEEGTKESLYLSSFDSSPNLYNAEFGINKVFNTTICGGCWDWAVGVVGYNQDYIKTSYDKSIPIFGKKKPGLEFIHEIISPVASIRINRCHSLGISLDVHLQRFKVNGLKTLASTKFSNSPTNVTNRGYDYSSGVGVSIGWKWDIMEALTLGATYHSKTSMRKFHKYKGLLAQEGRLDSPERYGLGLAYQYLPNSTITFDFEWINWHGVRSLHNPLDLANSDKLGSKRGSGFGFRNQIFFGVGVDYAINEFWIVRIGYRHTNTALRNTQTTLNILTCETIDNYLTLGATYTWKCNEFTLYFAHGFENDINGKTQIPKKIGGERIVRLRESNNTLGLSWGYIF